MIFVEISCLIIKKPATLITVCDEENTKSSVQTREATISSCASCQNISNMLNIKTSCLEC